MLSRTLEDQHTKIIAYELGFSIRTVDDYCVQLREKLGVRGTAETVRPAIAGGMLED